ncbi:B12-binding domain-containing protein [Actinoplanes sp. NPDC049548]|uniref:cobalamin B12-binding domain-containing protein n=1 Tax=Actinoplanes sp. NPDC049548 TaxID=3155152 RepID=UPI0034377CF8
MTGRDEALPAAVGDAYPLYLRCLARQDERAAVDLVLQLCTPDIDPETVMLHLVAPAMVQVGRWWQTNVWTVAQEHCASHITSRVVAALAATAGRPDPDRRVVVTCIERELHATPALLFAETLRLRGWNCVFLGSDVPTAHLITFLRRYRPLAVALSCSLPMRLPDAHRVLATCHSLGLPIIVGGRAFGADGRWAARLGAPWATNGITAIPLLDRPPRPAAIVAQPADDEYRALTERRGDLIRHTVRRLRATYPEETAEGFALDMTITDLGYILDHLAAAIYVDDGSLFTAFACWLADVLGNRGVPADAVELALSELARVLHDHPRSHRLLEQGHTAYRVSSIG